MLCQCCVNKLGNYRLKDNKGNILASYRPTEPQWWITSFNPYFPAMQACDLSVSFTVDFSEKPGMYDAFRKKWGNEDDTPWTFDPENPIATLNF
jgi:hypothetical protein